MIFGDLEVHGNRVSSRRVIDARPLAARTAADLRNSGPFGSDVEHPLSVSLREDAVLGQIDHWLALEFVPRRIAETIHDLAAAQDHATTARIDDGGEAERLIAECDRKLAQYRAALDAGANPVTVAAWIAETEAEKAAASSAPAARRRVPA